MFEISPDHATFDFAIMKSFIKDVKIIEVW